MTHCEDMRNYRKGDAVFWTVVPIVIVVSIGLAVYGIAYLLGWT